MASAGDSCISRGKSDLTGYTGYVVCCRLESEMTTQVQALGYVKGKSTGDMAFVPALQGITGHEFHYSRVRPDHDAQFAFHLTRGKGIDDGKDGLISA